MAQPLDLADQAPSPDGRAVLHASLSSGRSGLQASVRLPGPARNTSPQHFVISDRPSGLHIVTGDPFRRSEAVRHDDVYAAQQMKRHDR